MVEPARIWGQEEVVTTMYRSTNAVGGGSVKTRDGRDGRTDTGCRVRYERITRLLMLAALEIPHDVRQGRLEELEAGGESIRFEAHAEKVFLTILRAVELLMQNCQGPGGTKEGPGLLSQILFGILLEVPSSSLMARMRELKARGHTGEDDHPDRSEDTFLAYVQSLQARFRTQERPERGSKPVLSLLPGGRGQTR